jgi:GNAT superfamily N-acetyltransferase
MRIIRAEPSHIEQIMKIWNEFARYHQCIDPYYGTVEGGDIKFGEYIIHEMGQEDSQVLVAMEDNILLGYCLAYVHHRAPVFTESSVGVLSDLAIGEEYRGSGAGGALVEASLTWFRDKGVKRVELRTSAKNGPAIEFYRKHGFFVYDYMMTREI